MPGANPLLHATIPGTGRGYVTEQAEASVEPGARSSEIMPAQLAALLLGAGIGLWGLNKLGFRFVFEAGKMGK